METRQIQEEIAAIHRKLDVLTAYVDRQQQRARERQELRDDLTRIGQDVVQTAISELEEISAHFNTRDLLHLLKKLLRNTRTLTRWLDRLESSENFLQDAGPIVRDAFLGLLSSLDELDRKGYFAFFREVGLVVDRIVLSFTPRDVRLLGENITTILNTIKNLTQPEMLAAVNNAVAIYKNLNIELEREPSYWQLIRELRSPEIRQGIAVGLAFLKSLSNGRHRVADADKPVADREPIPMQMNESRNRKKESHQ